MKQRSNRPIALITGTTIGVTTFRYVTSEFAKNVAKPKVIDYTGDNVVDAFAARLGN
jgi:hypothetical protein